MEKTKADHCPSARLPLRGSLNGAAHARRFGDCLSPLAPVPGSRLLTACRVKS